MVDPTAVITSVTAALKAAKAWRDVEKAFEAAGFRAQLADVIDALTDAKLALADAKEQQSVKDTEIARLKHTIADRNALVEGEGGYKYAVGNNGTPIGFPVCPKCDQIDGRLIHLVQNGAADSAKCPGCDKDYRPVTCFLEGGETLLNRQSRIQNAAIARGYDR
jgi:uncharacterized protein YihD (DUF1040 family)